MASDEMRSCFAPSSPASPPFASLRTSLRLAARSSSSFEMRASAMLSDVRSSARSSTATSLGESASLSNGKTRDMDAVVSVACVRSSAVPQRLFSF
jgi:hypothetical protein